MSALNAGGALYFAQGDISKEIKKTKRKKKNSRYNVEKYATGDALVPWGYNAYARCVVDVVCTSRYLAA